MASCYFILPINELAARPQFGSSVRKTPYRSSTYSNLTPKPSHPRLSIALVNDYPASPNKPPINIANANPFTPRPCKGYIGVEYVKFVGCSWGFVFLGMGGYFPLWSNLSY